jgi:hypothetical protein
MGRSPEGPTVRSLLRLMKSLRQKMLARALLAGDLGTRGAGGGPPHHRPDSGAPVSPAGQRGHRPGAWPGGEEDGGGPRAKLSREIEVHLREHPVAPAGMSRPHGRNTKLGQILLKQGVRSRQPPLSECFEYLEARRAVGLPGLQSLSRVSLFVRWFPLETFIILLPGAPY